MVDQCTMILWEALDALEQVDGTQGAIVPDRPLEPGEIDWTEFDKAYDILLKLDFTLYTEESVYALFDVYDIVLAALDSGAVETQEDVDALTKLLVDAINALEPLNGELPPVVRPDGLDYSKIDAALRVAFSAKEENYSADTFAALQAAIDNAYEVMSNPECTQADVNEAYIALVDAINGLLYIGTELQPIIPPIRVPGVDEPIEDEDKPGTSEPGKDDTDVPGGDDTDDNTGTEDDGNLPGKTGDDFALVGLIVLMVVGIAGAAAAVILLKKNSAR
jgi:hypothetical protein